MHNNLVIEATGSVCGPYSPLHNSAGLEWYVAKMTDSCVFLQFPFVCASSYASAGTCFNSTGKEAQHSHSAASHSWRCSQNESEGTFFDVDVEACDLT